MEKYAGNSMPEGRRQMALHKRVRNQAFMYVGAFYFTWLFPTIFQLVIVIAGKFPYALLLLTAISVPIQGILNLIVFVYPKFVKYRNENPDINMIVAWFQMLHLEVTTAGSAHRTSSLMTSTRTKPKRGSKSIMEPAAAAAAQSEAV